MKRLNNIISQFSILISQLRKYFSTLNSHFSIQKGYTFIELLVVFSIIGIISSVLVASFVTFNNSRVIDGAATELANSYIMARQNAISQIKPPQCTVSQSLRGYRVVLNPTARTHVVEAMCGNVFIPVSRKALSSQTTVGTGSTTLVEFRVPGGTVNTQATITLTGYGKTKTIVVARTGSISVR